MSRNDELIRRHCPDGVEFVELGSVAEIGTGSSDRKDAIEDGVYPFYVRSKDVLRKDDFEFDEEAIIIPGEGGVGDIFHYANGKYSLHQRAYRIHLKEDSRVLTKYALYYFQANFKRHIFSKAVNSTVTSIRKPMITKFEIPVPPIEVQRGIVRILDAMCELEAKLQEELEAREKQFEYYREKLLNEAAGSWSVTLGDTMVIERGASPRPIKSYVTESEDGVPWIKIGDIRPGEKYIRQTKERITEAGVAKSRFLRAGSFVLSNSMSFGRPYILEIDGCIHDGWISMKEYDETFNTDFLFHLLSSYKVQAYWRQKASSGTVSNLNSDIVKATPVAVPPIETQRKIVEKLNAFEVLIQSLRGEIEYRHKQYEYYRDALLTFEKKGA